MLSTAVSTSAELQAKVHDEGFAFVQGVVLQEMLAQFGSLADWPLVAASWEALELDGYMADGGRYRRRRYGVFSAARGGPVVREPHQPHLQTLEYNPLHGGVPRWFEPITDGVAASASLATILAFCRSTFGHFAPATTAWGIEMHQFRIEARPGETGRPTPEGLHRDGVDYVLVLLVSRRNIASGVTSIHGLDGAALGHFTLEQPFDAAIVDDARVAHGVTPVQPLDPSLPAFRDVLVVTFKAAAD